MIFYQSPNAKWGYIKFRKTKGVYFIQYNSINVGDNNTDTCLAKFWQQLQILILNEKEILRDWELQSLIENYLNYHDTSWTNLTTRTDKMCIECFQNIPPGTSARKYCGEECRSIGMGRKTRRYPIAGGQ